MNDAPEQQPTTDSYAGLRVGDAERQTAIAALGDHWRAGRLDPAEHERRTTAAFSAVTRGDLDALFSDLQSAPPAAHPAAGPSLTKALDPSVDPSPEQVPAGPGSWLERNIGAVRTLVPLVAVALFFLLGSVPGKWVVFLLIPIAYTLLGTVGGHGGHGRRRDERRERRG